MTGLSRHAIARGRTDSNTGRGLRMETGSHDPCTCKRAARCHSRTCPAKGQLYQCPQCARIAKGVPIGADNYGRPCARCALRKAEKWRDVRITIQKERKS